MKQSLFLAIVLIAIFFLWNHIVLYPLKVLVVFFHESSHALMTVLTGGKVDTLVVNANQGGYVISRGGSRFLTLSAGYLGSLVWGTIIYLIAVRTRKDKAAMAILGGMIVGISFLFGGNLFGIVFCLLSGVIMISLGFKASEKTNDFILRLIGLTNMIYVPLDIYSDTISRSHLRSDAYMLAEEFGGVTLMWGGLWLVISVVVVIFALWWGMQAGPLPTHKAIPYKEGSGTK
ncbi:M50 family metallopeptidase [Desulfococcaceae bacterium HSG9]|nr:M50 family metallopeptidase [Desulfococcaceae bacterium HSG9]